MQYTITEKLKRLMYKILVAFLGVMFTCFSGVAQEEFSVLADIGYKEKITSALSSKLVEYKNTSVSKDTFLLKQSGERAIDMIAGNDEMLVDSVIINIDVESSWKNRTHKSLRWSLKTNLLYAATSTPNLGLEVDWGTQMSVNVIGGYNPWNRKGKKGDNDKIVHWLIQPELRYWFCEPAGGHFIGIHTIATQYNIGGHKFFHIFDKGYRYEGWGAGAGFTYGYSWMLSRRWAIEAYLGLGVVHLDFDKSNNKNWCCTRSEHFTKTYLGPTKVGLSLIYNINK